jgi:hypothetical protein
MEGLNLFEERRWLDCVMHFPTLNFEITRQTVRKSVKHQGNGQTKMSAFPQQQSFATLALSEPPHPQVPSFECLRLEQDRSIDFDAKARFFEVNSSFLSAD